MLIRVTTVMLLVFMSMSVYAGSADEYFNEGIAAFKQHRFNDAVAHFKKARQAGMSGTHLEYNLGVTYYRMEKYELAKESFLLVAKDAKYRQVAHYNLGLISRKTKDYTKALYWFKKAHAAPNGTRAIAKLAKKMIKKVSVEVDPTTRNRIAASVAGRTGENSLMPVGQRNLYTGLKGSLKRKSSTGKTAAGYNDPATTAETSRGGVSSTEVTTDTPKKPTAKKGKVSGGVRVAVGNDDNVEAVGTDSASNIDDTYFEFFGWVSIPLHKKVKILSNYYRATFNDVDQDYSAFSIGVQYTQRVGSWWLRPYVGFTTSDVDGDDYQDVTEYRITGSKKVGAGNWLVLRVAYFDISAENSIYSYEEGDKTQFRAEYYTRVSFGKVRFRYQYETNDREDAASTVNASADRHEFRVRLSRNFSTNWFWSGELGFRTSDYERDTLGRDREDDRVRLSLDINRKMNKQWKIGGRYTYTDNDSNVSAYEYDKNDYQIYTQYTF